MTISDTFKDYLKTLEEYSDKVKAGTITENDFVDFQPLDSKAREEYHTGHIAWNEYGILADLYHTIKQAIRSALRTDSNPLERG